MLAVLFVSTSEIWNSINLIVYVRSRKKSCRLILFCNECGNKESSSYFLTYIIQKWNLLKCIQEYKNTDTVLEYRCKFFLLTLKSPCKNNLSNKATIIFKPNIPHQHWCCLITCMSIHIESKWKLILTLWSCICKPYKAHQNRKTGSPHHEGLVHLADLLDTV